MAARDKMVNPFKPTAGMTPPVLVGRENVIDDFLDGLAEGPGAPGRLMRITGPRGSGKTVLLSEMGTLARQAGWTVVDVSGKEQICPTVLDQLSHDRSFKKLDVTFSLPFVSAEASFERAAQAESFRAAFADSVRALTGAGSGLMISVDEAQDASPEEMTVLATNVQYMIREGQNICLVFAGITTGVLDLLNGEGLTFLRRAKPEELAPIPVDDVAAALRKSIELSGLQIGDEALAQAAEATHGYAYLIQLVGYYVWREGRRHVADSALISVTDARRGSNAAREEFERAVLETAIVGLTKPAMEYLLAMTEDAGASSTMEIARRIDKPASSANTYRRMLIERQIIESTAPGYVAFSIPFMREYLANNSQAIMARYGE